MFQQIPHPKIIGIPTNYYKIDAFSAFDLYLT